jgi:copper chaperone CopZ
MIRTYRCFGISCDHCKHTIENALRELDGVSVVDVDVDSKTVRVGGDGTDESIRSALGDAGYEVAEAVND